MNTITITTTNTSVFDHTYQCRDGVSGATFTVFVGAGKSISISLQSNHSLDDGYGDLYWLQDGSATWNHSALLRDGETVTL